MNDNNLKNLKSRSAEERTAIAKKGAKASAKAKVEKRILKEELIKRLNAKDYEEIVDNLIERAKGSSKDFEVLRDTLGQKPRQDLAIDTEEEVTINVRISD